MMVGDDAGPVVIMQAARWLCPAGDQTGRDCHHQVTDLPRCNTQSTAGIPPSA